jgi:hypothetical protein
MYWTLSFTGSLCSLNTLSSATVGIEKTPLEVACDINIREATGNRMYLQETIIEHSQFNIITQALVWDSLLVS